MAEARTRPWVLTMMAPNGTVYRMGRFGSDVAAEKAAGEWTRLFPRLSSDVAYRPVGLSSLPKPGEPVSAHRYAIPLACCLPGNLPDPDGYPLCTEKSSGWYAVVAVGEYEAVVEDVRRSTWDVPEGVQDLRGAHRDAQVTHG